MSKQVRETAAGQSISAYIILNRRGDMVGNVQSHYSNGGTVTVDCWAYGAKRKDLQQGRAGGGGYDKFTAAIRGMFIDGVELFDHCGKNKQSERILKMYHKGTLTEDQARKRANKIGARFANFDQETHKYKSLHIQGGLDRLTAMGYRVLQAI